MSIALLGLANERRKMRRRWGS